MSTYSSIRIYISSNASILPKGFYDIIGYVGNEITPSSGVYSIDNVNNFPVIQSGIRYYKLVYYSSDGYRPTILDNSESLHLLVQDNAVPIYQSARDDAHLLTSADYPINADIRIVDISTLYLAYREYTMDVYQDYAIKNVGTIYDSNNIIDVIDSDFTLIPTNTDGINITPEEGLVENLYTFTLTFQTEVSGINQELSSRIALYDGNTNNIAISVDINSINQTSGTTVTFSLLSHITSPSTYYLYLPTGLFQYVNGTSSAIAIFAYSIRATESGGEIGEYIQNPTQGKELRIIRLTFPNISTVSGLSTITQISLTGGSVSESWDSGDVLSTSGNVVIITLPNTYTNSGAESIRYTITIPANTIAYTTLQYNNSAITLYYDLLPEGGDLPTGSDEYSVNFLPVSGSNVYSLSYLNIFIYLANRYGLISITDGHSLNEIFIKDYEGNTVGYVRRFEEKTPTTEGEQLLVEFDCSFDAVFNSSTAYTITIPEGIFSITSVSSGVSTTIYNPEWTLTYNIIQENPDTGHGTDNVSFYHNLIKVQGTEVSENIAFKIDDTIYINRSKLASIITWPVLSITKYDEFGSPESKEVLTPSQGDTINVNIRATYYNADNVLVSTTSTVDYGYVAEIYNRYDILRQLFREIGTSYPNYLKLHYSFTYNQQVLEYDIELQIIPNVLFILFKNNQNLQRNVRIDLYSGSLTDTEYGCLLLTGDFDSVLSYEDEGTIKYIAELVSTTKVRTGNLSGIYNYKFGNNQPNGFGLYGENVFLTGNFYLNNGKSLMDISDDILLANGNVKEVEEGLKNLDTSVKATIEALTEKQENFEAGLDTSIKNYISTNKNSVLKIGLDYSLWSLGSAGISLVNPNATYDFDPISGNYTVKPETVGDGDEYITLQGSKIQFSTYKNEWITVGNSEEEYIAVICSTASPELWLYPESIYDPRLLRSGNYSQVVFFLGYVKKLPSQTHTIAITDNTTEFLKYVMFQSTGIIDDNNFAASTTPSENSEYYTFSTYYLGTPGEINNDFKVKLHRKNEETELYEMVDAFDEIGNNTSIYFVPRVVTAGMFKDGKFNADFIEAKSLVAVDIDTQENTNVPKLDELGNAVVDEEGNVTYVTRPKYKRNPRFNPLLEISSINYPVLKNDCTEEIDKDANFVVVSGATGKISARGANISGTIIVGDDDSELSDTNYLLLSDGRNSDKSYAVLPGMYIASRVGGKEDIVAKFNGTKLTNPLTSFVRSATWSTVGTSGINKSSVFEMKYSETQIPYNTGNDNGGLQPDVPIIRSINTGGTTSYWTQWSTWYALKNGSSSSWLVPLFSGETTAQNADGDSYASIFVPAKTNKTVNFESGSYSITLSCSLTSQTAQKSPTASSTMWLEIYDENNVSCGTFGYKNVSLHGSGNNTVTGDIYTNYSITLYNTTNVAKTYKFKCRLSTNFSAYNSNNENSKTTSRPSYGNATVAVSVTISNFKISLGQESFSTEVFGNGLIVGYNEYNYFTTYFKEGDSTSSSRMIVDWKADGGGMKFDNGTFSYYLFNRNIPAFITILKGIVYINSSGDYNYYWFRGFSALSTYNSSSFYTYTTNTKYWVANPPYYSNYQRSSSGWLWWYDAGEDRRGYPVNYGNSNYTDGTDQYFACTYSSNMDIYIVWVGTGSVLIAFGEKWNSLFKDTNVFLTEENIKVSAIGIGKGVWNGSTSATTRVPYGSIFPICKPPFTNNAGITGNNVQFKLKNVGGSSDATVAYNGISTSTPKICNAIQFDLADNESFDDGAFYLTIDLCPNKLTSQ